MSKSNRLYLTFQEKEMDSIKKEAELNGLPIQIYIHRKISPDYPLYINIEKIFKAIQKKEENEIFTISDILDSLNLKNLNHSDLSFIGKAVKNSIDILNIKEIKKISGIAVYKKLKTIKR